jgi:hypothetical protein
MQPYLSTSIDREESIGDGSISMVITQPEKIPILTGRSAPAQAA